jgi:hypothetical protein
MTAKKTRLGMVASSEAAASGPSRAACSAPVNFTSVSGRVALSGSLRITRAKKNSFHEEMNANSRAATTPGASSGAITRTRVRTRPAPSTAAASSSSRGTPRT